MGGGYVKDKISAPRIVMATKARARFDGTLALASGLAAERTTPMVTQML